MSLPVRLRRVAQVEFEESAGWYESQSVGLGVRFVESVKQVFVRISETPDRWPEIWPGVREAPVPRWPFAIYYQWHDDHVMVLAVFHTARNPDTWRSRA